MYRLIIVDDEEEIRDGLSELVDWTTLGFVVAAKLQDGADAIRYLQEHEVDVILTDIKMAFSSGLDLAKYVHERSLAAKVVILSGFQEFALAREAISYNVSHYLLKPTDLDEVAQVFRAIRGELDEDGQKRELILRQNQHVKTLRPLLMEQFFFNLLLGSGWNRDIQELEARLKQLGLGDQACSRRCCMMSAEWFMKEQEPGQSRLEDRQSISMTITKEREEVHYTCVHVSARQFLIIGNPLLAMSADTLQKKAEQLFLHIQHSLGSLLGVSIRLEQLQLYSSMMEMIDQYHRSAAPLESKDNKELLAPEESPEAERMIIRKAKQFIAEHFEMELALVDVARHVGLNPVYFSRLFKQETGQTYSDYCIDMRIKKAMDYLQDPKYKVYEIGFLVGYKNIKYFHKLFKRQTGLTPSEYRDKL
ncbi:MAG: hypothetical protein K0R57_2071 [Paenibacillaceae bacterium]|jgi:two-component system response regulator YesN|nr:hypothetical protein [Paenibacillaceae bacterium]